MSDIAGAVSRLNNYVSTAGGMGMETQVSHDIALILAELGRGASVPAGWVLVPIEPTWDMRNEGREFLIDGLEKDYEKIAYFLWKTMVNASPKAPDTRPPVAGLAELTDEQWYSLWDAMDDIQIPPCNFKDTIELKAAMAKAARVFLGKVDG